MMVGLDINTNAPFNDLVNRVAAPGTACTVGISGARGRCPLGFMQEDVWEVDEKGMLSFPLCPPAVRTINPLLKKISEGRDFDSRGECRCPYGECRLSFVVHSPKMFEKTR